MLKIMFGWWVGCIIGIVLNTLLNMKTEGDGSGVGLIALCALAGVCLGAIWNEKRKEK